MAASIWLPNIEEFFVSLTNLIVDTASRDSADLFLLFRLVDDHSLLQLSHNVLLSFNSCEIDSNCLTSFIT